MMAESRRTEKERFKMTIKEKTDKIVNESWKSHWIEYEKMIEDELKGVADKALDDSRINDLAKSAGEITFKAMAETAGKVAEEVTEQLKPQIIKLVEEYQSIITEAMSESVQELILQRVKLQMIKLKNEANNSLQENRRVSGGIRLQVTPYWKKTAMTMAADSADPAAT